MYELARIAVALGTKFTPGPIFGSYLEFAIGGITTSVASGGITSVQRMFNGSTKKVISTI